MQFQEDLGGSIFRVRALPEEVPTNFQDITIVGVIERTEQYWATLERRAHNDAATLRVFQQN
jgi:hypothetical protein